ncbi:MAG: FAD:protein FMN transferase [Deltaproteobacteria bacterium]|nr:FAD:protein FMN transferase [Deltaproteobacteria bacterium]
MLAAALLVGMAVFFRFLWSEQTAQLETLVLSGNTMATTWQVKVVGSDFSNERKAHLAKIISEKLDMVNSQMSPYHRGGDIYRLNEAAMGEAVRVHPEVLVVLHRAIDISVMTGGAFDVTVGPLIRLWGFHDKKELLTPPSDKAIKEAKAKIGYQHLRLDDASSTVTKAVAGLDVDLSAIAKGRAVDMVAETLDAAGEENYMIEVGGEIRCLGKNDSGRAWRIGIEKPAGPGDVQRSVLEVVDLSSLSMATSGDYRSYYMINNERFSHTINPTTGKPVSHALASVSVLTSDCMTADALATGFTVLGLKESIRIADKHGYAAYFVERVDGGFKTIASKMFERRFGMKESEK